MVGGLRNMRLVLIRFVSDRNCKVYDRGNGNKLIDEFTIPKNEFNKDKGLSFICSYLNDGIIENLHFG